MRAFFEKVQGWDSVHSTAADCMRKVPSHSKSFAFFLLTSFIASVSPSPALLSTAIIFTFTCSTAREAELNEHWRDASLKENEKQKLMVEGDKNPDERRAQGDTLKYRGFAIMIVFTSASPTFFLENASSTYSAGKPGKKSLLLCDSWHKLGKKETGVSLKARFTETAFAEIAEKSEKVFGLDLNWSMGRWGKQHPHSMATHKLHKTSVPCVAGLWGCFRLLGSGIICFQLFCSVTGNHTEPWAVQFCSSLIFGTLHSNPQGD